MGRRRIFTVGFELPGDEFEVIEFESNRTLLDADIILFEPTLGQSNSFETYNGKPLLDEHSSFTTKEYLGHWRSEIVAAVTAGKMVIVYLTSPKVCYRYTGQKTYSGSGRARATNAIVAEISSYEAVPNLARVTAKMGDEIRLERSGSLFAEYWHGFSRYSRYQVEIEGEFKSVILKDRTGNRIVGASIQGGAGLLIFLPPLRFDEESFIQYDGRSKKSYWTKEAIAFSKRLAASLASLADAAAQSFQVTPAPSWSLESHFRLPEEDRIEGEIVACTGRLNKIQAQKGLLESQLLAARGLRGLLYEQGRPLEGAVLEALNLFGFNTQRLSDGESEFDVVFESAEGRCIGEIEGKDRRAINIDKMSQLERNLQEDFARDGVETYAKGVLFGNAQRLLPLGERQEFFTTKCMSAAERTGIALVRTPDLFGPAKYLRELPQDVEYASECRRAILATKGAVVIFPQPAVGRTTEPKENNSVDRSPDCSETVIG